MSTYPGDEQRPADEHDDVELTQPVGYWERQAAERAREQERRAEPAVPPSGGAVFNPTSGQPVPGSGDRPSPPAPPAYGQQGYGQQPYAPQAPPYGQAPQVPAYGQPGHGQPPYGFAPPQYAAYAPPRDHTRATTALVLGLISVIGAFLCAFPLLLSPVAWGVGRGALREIRASHGQLGGESSARAGMVLGIAGTVLLVLAVLALVALVVLFGMGMGTVTYETGNV